MSTEDEIGAVIGKFSNIIEMVWGSNTKTGAFQEKKDRSLGVIEYAL